MSAAIASGVAPVAEITTGLELLPALGFSDEVIQQLRSAAEDANTGSSDAPLKAALEVVGAFPLTLHRNATLGIPQETTARTLRDLERRMLEYRQLHGTWGFDRFAWMQNHLAGSLFEIGRLQFMFGSWRESFEVYQEPETRETWALANEGLVCDKQGLPRSEVIDSAFRTVREITVNGLVGHTADPRTGAISPLPLRLPASSQLAAASRDTVLHVHIPSGPGFTAAACAQSLREARLFFTRYYPDTEFKAICCRTWLLDPALREIMPAESNMLGLGRLFRLLTVPGANARQHLERIFGSEVDWRTCVPQTRLQKAAQEFLARGGEFHLTSGYLLWDDPQLIRKENEDHREDFQSSGVFV